MDQHLHQNHDQLNLPNYQQGVATLYEQRHQLPPAAQEALFWQPLETLMEQPAPQLQKWVQRGHSYFNQQLKAAKTQAALKTPDIQKFFGKQTQLANDLQPPWETLLHWTSVGLLCMH